MSTYRYDPSRGVEEVKVNKKKADEGKEISWVAIVVGFAIFWPVGLGLLVAKIAQLSKKTGSHEAWLQRQQTAMYRAQQQEKVQREKALRQQTKLMKDKSYVWL